MQKVSGRFLENLYKLDFQGRQAPPQSSVIIAELCYQKCYTAAAAAVVNSTLYI